MKGEHRHARIHHSRIGIRLHGRGLARTISDLHHFANLKQRLEADIANDFRAVDQRWTYHHLDVVYTQQCSQWYGADFADRQWGVCAVSGYRYIQSVA